MMHVSKKYGRLARGSDAPPSKTETPSEAARKLFHDTRERVAEQEDQFELGLALAERGMWADARARFQQLAIANPKVKKYRLHLHYSWGREHEANRNIDRATSEYRHALNIDPSFEPAKSAIEKLTDKPRGLFARLFNR